MNQGRGFKNLPPTPPGPPAGSGDDLEWGEASDEELFDRATLIPEILPTEAELLRSATIASQLPTPVPPPLEAPSQVIAKPVHSRDSDLEFDLGSPAPTQSPRHPTRPITIPPVVPPRPSPAPSQPLASTSRRLMQPLRPPSTARASSPQPAPSAPQPPASQPVQAPSSAPRPAPAAPVARASTPFSVDIDPLFDDLDNPPRVADASEFDDFDKLRDPQLKAPPRKPPSAAPSSSAPSSEEPHTAPYPLDDWDLDKGYMAGHLRQPPPTAAATSPIEEPISEALRSPRPQRPVMGDSRHPSLTPTERLVRDMRDKFALGDFSGSLKAAEELLAVDASSSEANRFADNCRSRLRGMFEAKLGSLTRIPRVVLPPDQIRWLSLDHRSGFVLSCVDGYSSIEEILDVSGMPHLDTLRILHELLQQRVIAV